MQEKTEQMTPVQAARHGARDEGRAARDILAGITGLSKEDQLERLSAAKARYEAAAEILGAAIGIVEDRDHEAYQATKHQGLAGWYAHLTHAHEVDVDNVALVMGLEQPPIEILTELAYQLHKQLPEHAHN